jgi:hypothetical protein
MGRKTHKPKTPAPGNTPQIPVAPDPQTPTAAYWRLTERWPYWLRLTAFLSGALFLAALALFSVLQKNAGEDPQIPTVTSTATVTEPPPPDTIGTSPPPPPSTPPRVVILTEEARSKSTSRLRGIVSSAAPAESMKVDVISIDRDWRSDGRWSEPAPSLVVVHSSAFSRVPGVTDHRIELLRFIAGFDRRSPGARYLVYANFDGPDAAAKWIDRARDDYIAQNLGPLAVVERIEAIDFDYRSPAPNIANAQRIQTKVRDMSFRPAR